MRTCSECGEAKGEFAFISKTDPSCVQCTGKAAARWRGLQLPDVWTRRCERCNKRYRMPKDEMEAFWANHVCDPKVLERRWRAMDAAHAGDGADYGARRGHDSRSEWDALARDED